MRYVLWEELDLEKQGSFHDSRGIAAVFHTSVSRKIDIQIIRESDMVCSTITNYRKIETDAQPLSKKMSTGTVFGSEVNCHN